MGAGMLGNLNDIDLRMLRTFCAIVEAGGFTAAQARLNTSLSRLSVLVRDLEVRLGYSLCRRGNGGFQLTEEGQELYDAALGLFSDIARFREQVRGLGGRDREALHLAASMASSASIACRCRWPSGCFASAPRRCCSSCTRGVPTNSSTRCWKSACNWRWGPFTTGCPGSTTNPVPRGAEPLLRQRAPLLRPGGRRADTGRDLRRRLCRPRLHGGKPSPARPALQPGDRRLHHGGHRYPGLQRHLHRYLPTHYAATWVAEGRMRAIRPRQLAYDSEFHCITRQGHEERPTLTLFLRSLFEAQKQLGVQAPANTNGIARQL